MERIKAIRTEADYEQALALLEQLVDADPAPGSDDAERIEVLSILIENYERTYYPDTLPTPVEAIRFKMDQLDLTQNDLVKYIGSKARVSEVLSGKRGLSLEMIRELEAGLGIPAQILVQKNLGDQSDEYDTWDRKVFNEMAKRGYFDNTVDGPDTAQILRNFFSSITGANLQVKTLLRQSNYRTLRANKYALTAWTGYVLKQADDLDGDKNVSSYFVDANFMHEIAKLSIFEDGPVRAQKKLLKNNILLIIEPSLPGTRLDGATVLRKNRKPVIGMTLRHDRLDNFWFTLMHELAHVALHRSHDEYDLYFDELFGDDKLNVSDIEQEADKLAAEALIPSEAWKYSPAKLAPSPITAKLLAKEQGVHIAIVLGRLRYESGRWASFAEIMKDIKVQYLFPNKIWKMK